MDPSPRRPFLRRTTGLAARLAAGVVVALVGLLWASPGGCHSGAREETARTASAAPAGEAGTAGAAEPASLLSVAEEVERQYVIGPAAARRLGYRIDWQQPSWSGRTIKMTVVEADSVFALDEGNFLSRIRREEGDRLWRLPIAKQVVSVFGMNYVPELDRLYLATGGDLLVIDASTGSRIGKQRLNHPANTAAVRLGDFLVYGSRNGQLVWHSFVLDSDWRGYKVSQAILVPPVYEAGYLVAVGSDGRIMSLRADSASQVWTKRALAPIVAAPVAGNGVVYVASLDQHLRAFDLGSNRTPLWEYLTESPLEFAPTLIGDRVYQQVPDQGLLCLEAQPQNSPGGRVVWQNADVTGSVLARTRENLLITWDEAGRRLTTVDARFGAIVDDLTMPEVDSVMSIGVEKAELYATGLDGRLCRLVPKH